MKKREGGLIMMRAMTIRRGRELFLSEIIHRKSPKNDLKGNLSSTINRTINRGRKNCGLT